MRKSLSISICVCDKCGFTTGYAVASGLPDRCPQCGDVTIQQTENKDTNKEINESASSTT